MSDACTDLDRLLDEHPNREPELPGALAEHAASCDACRERLETHRLFATAFADRPVPELSRSFDARLRRSLARERRRLRLVLYGYWAAALVASVAVVRTTTVPAAIPESAGGALVVAVVFTLGALLLPAAALFRGWVRTPGLG